MSDFGMARQSRRQFLINAALASAAAGIGGSALTACGQGGSGAGTQGGKAKGRSGTQGETLFIAGFQWGPPNQFNPLGQSTAWPAGEGSMQLIYETLVRFNLLDGSLQPGLGKEVQSPDKNTLVVPLEDGTKWQDGQDLTARLAARPDRGQAARRLHTRRPARAARVPRLDGRRDRRA